MLSEMEEFLDPGNYKLVTFDAFVWTDPVSRREHLCQLGASYQKNQTYFRWIHPNISETEKRTLLNFPFVSNSDGSFDFKISENDVRSADGIVSCRKGVEQFIEFLERLSNDGCDGLALMTFKRSVIPCLIMSVIQVDDFKRRFAKVVKAIGDVRTYLQEQQTTINMEFTSVHTTAMSVLKRDIPATGRTDENSAIIWDILNHSFENSPPSFSFLRRYCIPIRSEVVKEMILHRQLTYKIGNFSHLQNFIERRLEPKVDTLIPSGVFFDLSPNNSSHLSYRLSVGAIRALIAAGNELQTLKSIYVNRGAVAFEVSLRSRFIEVILSRQPKIADEQTFLVLDLIVSYFVENFKEERTRKSIEKIAHGDANDEVELKSHFQPIDFQDYQNFSRLFRSWFRDIRNVEEVLEVVVVKLLHQNIDRDRLLKVSQNITELELTVKSILPQASSIHPREMMLFLNFYLNGSTSRR